MELNANECTHLLSVSLWTALTVYPNRAPTDEVLGRRSFGFQQVAILLSLGPQRIWRAGNERKEAPTCSALRDRPTLEFSVDVG